MLYTILLSTTLECQVNRAGRLIDFFDEKFDFCDEKFDCFDEKIDLLKNILIFLKNFLTNL